MIISILLAFALGLTVDSYIESWRNHMSKSPELTAAVNVLAANVANLTTAVQALGAGQTPDAEIQPAIDQISSIAGAVQALSVSIGGQ